MTRWLVLAMLTFALVAPADELPANACSGKQAVGDDCSTDDGTPGRCVEEHHEYVGDDGKHTWTELICQPLVSSAQRSVLPWVGLGLAFLAVCAALATRPRGRGVQSAP